MLLWHRDLQHWYVAACPIVTFLLIKQYPIHMHNSLCCRRSEWLGREESKRREKIKEFLLSSLQPRRLPESQATYKIASPLHAWTFKLLPSKFLVNPPIPFLLILKPFPPLKSPATQAKSSVHDSHGGRGIVTSITGAWRPWNPRKITNTRVEITVF